MFGLSGAQLALKAGPWIGIAILLGLLYIEHMRLSDCTTKNAMLTLEVKEATANIQEQNRAISDLNKSGNILSKELRTSHAQAVKIIHDFVPVTFGKNLDCHAAVQKMREVLK